MPSLYLTYTYTCLNIQQCLYYFFCLLGFNLLTFHSLWKISMVIWATGFLIMSHMNQDIIHSTLHSSRWISRESFTENETFMGLYPDREGNATSVPFTLSSPLIVILSWKIVHTAFITASFYNFCFHSVFLHLWVASGKSSTEVDAREVSHLSDELTKKCWCLLPKN